MALLAWRKLQAGLSGKGEAQAAAKVVQNITNTTIQGGTVDATLYNKGVVLMATATEIDTDYGNANSNLAINPIQLNDSYVATGGLGVIAVDALSDVTVADGKAYIPVPSKFNGMNLIRAQAIVNTAGTTNATTIDIYNVTDSQDMLSTAISIASGATVGTVGTINASYDDVSTNDVLRVDVTTVSTTAPKGLLVVLEFRLP